MANDNRTGLQRVKDYFDIGTKKSKKTVQVFPSETKQNASGQFRRKRKQLPASLESYYDRWLSSNSDTNETLRSRLERYKDLDFMYYNSAIISRAVHMYSDEVTQADAQKNIIQVTSENTKLTKYIYNLIQQWGFTQERLNGIAFNIALYGDAFTVNNTTDEGITDVTLLDVRAVKDRIEFSVNNMKQQKSERCSYSSTGSSSRQNQLDQLGKTLTDKNSNMSGFYKDYLFGFQLEKDIVLPPWNISHYRIGSEKSEFTPFGRPLLINAIAPFRKWFDTEALVATARVSKFPKEKFTVKVDENMTGVDQWNAIEEAKEEYNNVNQTNSDKDNFGLGEQIWTAEGLIDMNLIENSMRLDDIADLTMLQTNLAISTGVPMSFLTPGENSSFGDTGISLTYQYKPFGRTVYKIQSVILNEIVQMIRTHIAITGDFETDVNFNLAMNYPILEESSDRMRAKSDSFRLAKDIVDGLSAALGLDRDESLPVEVVMSVLGSESYLSYEDIEDWVKIYKKTKPKNEVNESKINDRIDEDLFDSVCMDSYRNLSLREGVRNNSHFVNAYNISKEQTTHLEILSEHYKKQRSKLEEAKK